MATGMVSSHFEIGKERSVVDRLLEWVLTFFFFLINFFFVQKVFAKQFQHLRMIQNQQLQRAIFNSNKSGLLCHHKQHTSCNE